ncbi:hypothetical protein NDA11_006792 [Ustilago hordei]|nr:hypothetical protein NDA15_003046 [Ustilago hordei]KAJ1580859.1 hypothetical protein NDA12_007872 [Ustilago hordei]KAJ1581615.1 hypothetical protein NDA11_006792 [Ustilago hordei]KAJ1597258.1 hypothetical protein NDA14_002220 [Ustilago hordei]
MSPPDNTGVRIKVDLAAGGSIEVSGALNTEALTSVVQLALHTPEQTFSRSAVPQKLADQTPSGQGNQEQYRIAELSSSQGFSMLPGSPSRSLSARSRRSQNHQMSREVGGTSINAQTGIQSSNDRSNAQPPWLGIRRSLYIPVRVSPNRVSPNRYARRVITQRHYLPCANCEEDLRECVPRTEVAQAWRCRNCKWKKETCDSGEAWLQTADVKDYETCLLLGMSAEDADFQVYGSRPGLLGGPLDKTKEYSRPLPGTS